MKNKEIPVRYTKKIKFLLVLPLLTLPFITILFWVLGGGRTPAAVAASGRFSNGLNMLLPEARPRNEKGWNKLSFYQAATMDSIQQLEAKKWDPYWNRYLGQRSMDSGGRAGPLQLWEELPRDIHTGKKELDTLDPVVSGVYQKMAQIQKLIDHPSDPVLASGTENSPVLEKVDSTYQHQDLDRMEKLLRAFDDDSGYGRDMHQLNGVLDKLISLRNRTDQNEKGNSPLTKPGKAEKAPVYLFRDSDSYLNRTLPKRGIHRGGWGRPVLDSDTYSKSGIRESTIYSITSLMTDSGPSFPRTIRASIPETQSIIPGGTIKLELEESIVVGGIRIPAETLCYGVSTLENDRLQLAVHSLRYQNDIIPVDLQAYDLDGLEGLYVPGSPARDASSTLMDQTMNGIDFTTLNPSLGAQAASAGVQAAKSLFRKRVHVVHISIKAGYQVLLQNNSNLP